MLNILILAGVVATASVLMWPRLANAPLWRATITPLASIIGSGFLVLGPILDVSFGYVAPLVMLGLCVIAYLFGWTIRFNIKHIDSNQPRSRLIERLEDLSSLVLAFAYIISVAYYLNLFGAFGVSLTAFGDSYHARLVTTAVFVLILSVGWLRGFSALERLEQISVGLKLAIIVGLLVGLSVHLSHVLRDGPLFAPPPKLTGWAALMIPAGLLVTVQGFETTRYLGATYDAATRIRSMRIAQWISTAIYLLYIGLLTFSFDSSVMTLKETAIIDLMVIVAPILPLLLVAAALSAQFSAAVADTTGSGGLIDEITGGRIKPRSAYAVIVGLGLMLTWSANIFEIISYASRAFAAYYTLQAAIAALSARDTFRTTAFGVIAAAGLFAALFGVPVE